MKKIKFLLPLTILAGMTLAGCDLVDSFLSSQGNLSTPTNQSQIDKPEGQSQDNGSTSEGEGNQQQDATPDFSGDVIGEDIVIEVEETPEEPEVENEGDFSFTTSDGVFEKVDNVYTITAAGTYVAKGVLEEGQLLVNAGDEDEVVIELNGATITYSQDSPIKALNAGKVEISAKKGSANAVYDNRSAKTVDDSTQGAGAIYAKCDLKLKGAGSLVVEGNYNSGVHTSDDLTIQKQELHVTSYNNALKGNDSVEIVSGTITAISKTGNGIKTENTDVSSKGNQRGNIDIKGGTIFVDAPNDAIEAAYNLTISEESADVPTEITIKTGANSQFPSAYNSKTMSAHALKAENVLEVNGGKITIQASDDSLHANYGTAFENGSSGVGDININGGTINIASGDDGIHADNNLNIAGGEILITNAYEGIEATHINISGGYIKLHGTDDGVNAAKKVSQTPSITISGGTLDVQVSSGDTDGIDSNGTFTQTGGLVISRGSPNTANRMSTGLDCDGTAKITGGTFIAFNGLEKTPSVGSGVLYAYYGSSTQGGGGPGPGGGGGWGGPGGWGGSGGSGSTSSNTSKFQSGTYTLSGGEFSKTFYNQFTYSTFIVYSSEMVTGTSYTLANGSSTVLSWTQNSTSQSIA